jgi:hypothetical protein
LFINTKASTRPFTNFNIKMALTSATYLYTSPTSSLPPSLTTVFTSASYTTIALWNAFTLSTPFTWDGVSSIVVEICYDNGSVSGGAGADVIGMFQDGGAANQANTIFKNGINCSTAITNPITVFTGTSGAKPIIRFTTPGPTQIETVVSSTSSLHIESGSNDYFYSNNGRLMMHLIAVSAPLGCVNSTLDAAGTTWVSYSGGQRSAKVFAVTPTTNGSTTNYIAYLYFSNAELGGKAAGTLRIAKTTAASVAASNSSNTVIVTPSISTLGPNTTVYMGNFTGFSRFFLVDAAVTLPVELISFTGKLNDEKNTVLNWITASEQNNKQFDLEYSNNGADFSLLSSVPSQGNSGSEQRYEYLHHKPQPGTTWYRLKQIDIDGRTTYSNIINVVSNGDGFRPVVYPVPSKDIITVNFGMMLKKADIEILSADMKAIKRESVNGMQLKKDINIHSLPQGLYFIRITTDNNTKLLRFVKQ